MELISEPVVAVAGTCILLWTTLDVSIDDDDNDGLGDDDDDDGCTRESW